MEVKFFKGKILDSDLLNDPSGLAATSLGKGGFRKNPLPKGVPARRRGIVQFRLQKIILNCSRIF
jgi:hypothetical protein